MSLSPLPVSAPGKLFLLGEYAVLAGGVALLTTLNRRVFVKPRSDDRGYEVRGGSVEDPLRLPMLVQQVLRQKLNREVNLNSLSADVSQFYDGEQKLGLGSSAASTVALLSSVAPDLSPSQRFDLAWEIHHRLQGKLGSGADIAASVFGSNIAYRLHADAQQPPFDALSLPPFSPIDVDPIATPLATIHPLDALPDDIRLDAVWTGRPAHSTSFIRGVKRAIEDAPQRVQRLFVDLAEASESGIDALVDDRSADLFDTFAAADRAMEALGEVCDLPIITDDHRHIRALAHTSNSVAKPSGAGGGDFSLLLSPRDAALPQPIIDQYPTFPVHPLQQSDPHT